MKQRVKSIAEAPEINDLLDELEKRLKAVERRLKTDDNEYTIEDVKLAFLEKKKSAPHFFEFFHQIVEQVKGTHRVKSLREYNTVITDLKAFEKHSGMKLSFPALNIEFFNKFLGFL